MSDQYAGSPISMALDHTKFALTSGGAKTVAYDAMAIMLRGKTKDIAAGAGVAVPANDAITGKPYEELEPQEVAAVLVSLKFSDGSIQMSQGPKVKMNAGQIDPHGQAPIHGPLPEDSVPIGVIVFGNATAANTRLGTPNWNAANIKAEAVAVGTQLDRPAITEFS